MSSKSGIAINPSTPSAVVAMFSWRARARPSKSESMPTIAATSSDSDNRSTFIIRSVPMLPDPMMATLVLCTGRSFRGERRGHRSKRGDVGVNPVSRRHRDHWTERTREDELAGPQWIGEVAGGTGQPAQRVERIAEAVCAATLRHENVVAVHLHPRRGRVELI